MYASVHVRCVSVRACIWTIQTTESIPLLTFLVRIRLHARTCTCISLAPTDLALLEQAGSTLYQVLIRTFLTPVPASAARLVFSNTFACVCVVDGDTGNLPMADSLQYIVSHGLHCHCTLRQVRFLGLGSCPSNQGAKITPVAGLIFETKNRAIFLKRFFWREIPLSRKSVLRPALQSRFRLVIHTGSWTGICKVSRLCQWY